MTVTEPLRLLILIRSIFFSRNQLSFNKNFKAIADNLQKINHVAVPDGEIVIEDETGRSDFQLLQNYIKTGKGTLKYYVFDILNLDGNDTYNLKDRPESMNRFPNGINDQSFYQKDVNLENSLSWLKTEKIYSESNDKYIDYLLCNDKATLLYMANLGCIEFNQGIPQSRILTSRIGP